MDGMVERKYALTRVASGDYLLPSNDGKTLWRIKRYFDEEADAELSLKPGWYWAAWRFLGSLDADTLDVDDWEQWDMWSWRITTRKECIDDALGYLTP